MKKLEARVGIEPTHKGFADLSLTAWVPRPGQEILLHWAVMKPVCVWFFEGTSTAADWSGRRDLNPRPSPWQGDALPLSYSRLVLIKYIGWAAHGQRGRGLFCTIQVRLEWGEDLSAEVRDDSDAVCASIGSQIPSPSQILDAKKLQVESRALEFTPGVLNYLETPSGCGWRNGLNAPHDAL